MYLLTYLRVSYNTSAGAQAPHQHSKTYTIILYLHTRGNFFLLRPRLISFLVAGAPDATELLQLFVEDKQSISGAIVERGRGVDQRTLRDWHIERGVGDDEIKNG